MQRRPRRSRDIAGNLGDRLGARNGPLALAALAAGALLACASAPPAPAPAPAWDEARRAAAAALESALAAESQAPDGELVVRLAFAADADLDLYVTDPLDETIYFGNTPARSGGALDADRRCADEAPRVETVRFARPLAGRYRVGVDFQQRCPGGESVAAWAIRIDSRGDRRVLRGLAEWNVFASRVDEFLH